MRRMLILRSTVALAASVMIMLGVVRFVRLGRPTSRMHPTPVQVVVRETPVRIGRAPDAAGGGEAGLRR